MQVAFDTKRYRQGDLGSHGTYAVVLDVPPESMRSNVLFDGKPYEMYSLRKADKYDVEGAFSVSDSLLAARVGYHRSS